MKIITCNLPESFLDAIDKLINVYHLYPSRSEVIRVAAREFVIKERAVAAKFEEFAAANPPLFQGKRIIDMRTIRFQGGSKQ